MTRHTLPGGIVSCDHLSWDVVPVQTVSRGVHTVLIIAAGCLGRREEKKQPLFMPSIVYALHDVTASSRVIDFHLVNCISSLVYLGCHDNGYV